MDPLIDLLADNDTVAGRLVTSGAIVVAAYLVAVVLGWVIRARSRSTFGRYYARKATRYAAFLVAVIALAVVWRPFAGQIGVVLGLIGAGVAFAMQEVIGALAGWFNVTSGRIYSVGDRIEMGGVQGDVIDITPLRTKVLEMGASGDGDPGGQSWVGGRQYTGRVIAVSNKATFTEPVFNYSAMSGYLWEELTIPVRFDSDWRRAEQIMLEEVQRTAEPRAARDAIDHLKRRYPVPRAEIEPRVFVRATDNWIELAARFVVPIRAARSVKDDVTRRVLERFDASGISVASETIDATIRRT